MRSEQPWTAAGVPYTPRLAARSPWAFCHCHRRPARHARHGTELVYTRLLSARWLPCHLFSVYRPEWTTSVARADNQHSEAHCRCDTGDNYLAVVFLRDRTHIILTTVIVYCFFLQPKQSSRIKMPNTTIEDDAIALKSYVKSYPDFPLPGILFR